MALSAKKRRDTANHAQEVHHPRIKPADDLVFTKEAEEGLNARENRPSPRRERERLLGREFAQRHRSAIAARKIEAYIFESDEYDVRDLEETIEALDAPEGLKDRLVNVADRFIAREKALDETERRMLELLELHSLEDAPDYAGEVLHVSTTNKEPYGKIYLTRQPGYFMVEYHDPADYVEAHGEGHRVENDRVIADSLAMFLDAAGVRLRADASIEHLRKPKRAKQDTVQVHDVVPTVYVNLENAVFGSTPENVRERVEALLVHERTHAIYEFFANKEDLFDEYKNELLARIREGADLKAVMSFFASDLYKDEFNHDLRDKDLDALDAIYQDIYELLDQVFDSYQNTQERGVLTYHLLDRDFNEIPDALEEINVQTEKLLASIVHLEPPSKHDWPELKEKTRATEDVRRLRKAWKRAYKETQSALLTKTTQEAREDVRKLEVLAHHAQEAHTLYLSENTP